MNENYINPKTQEHQSSGELQPQRIERSERPQVSDEVLRESRKQQLEKLETARREAAHEAQPIHSIEESLVNAAKSQLPQKPIINRELQDMAFSRQLIRIQRHLLPYGRTISRIIHQPVIEAVSETAGKTIGRPSGILGGGTVAFFGTLAYYYVARHYGYNYNAFIFLILLFLGIVAGWTVEVLWNIVKIGRGNR